MPVTPREEQERSSGWLGYGAGSLAVLAGAYMLGKNPKTLYAMGETLDTAVSAISDVTTFGKQHIVENLSRITGKFGSSIETAARSPSSTKALNPEIFNSLQGALSAWESGAATTQTLRDALAAKFSNVTTVRPGVRNLQVKEITQAFSDITPDDPFTLFGRSIDKKGAGLLKQAQEIGIVDKDWVADKGMFIDGQRLVDANIFRPEKWGESLVKTLRGATGGFLTDSLLPSTHLLREIPDIAEISTKGLGKHIKEGTLDKAFKIGDQLVGITKDNFVVDLPKLRVGPVGNAISKAHAIRKGLVRHRTVDEMKELLASRGQDLNPRQEKLYRALENRFLSEYVGIGPQYASETALPKMLHGWLAKFYQTDLKPISMIPGKSFDEVWENLSIGQRVKVMAKGDVDSVAWARTSIAGDQDIRSFEQIQEIKRAIHGESWEAALDPSGEISKTTSVFGRRSVTNAEQFMAEMLDEEFKHTMSHNYYAYDTAELAGNWAHTVFTTPFRIASNMFGFGLKHDSLGKTALRATVGIPMAGYLAWQGANYLDFLTEQTTTFSPIKGVARTYAEAQIAKQSMANLIGISYASKTAESMIGIDIDSPISVALRSIGLPILGAKIGQKINPGMGRPGMYVGIGLAALTLSDDLSRDADELRDIYEGRKEVPVRKSRWWMLGCFDPHQSVMLEDGSLVHAEDVDSGMVVINDIGEYTEVTNVSVRITDKDEELISILPHGFPYPTKITGNHEVLVHRRPCIKPYTYKTGCHPRRITNSSCRSCPNASPDLNLSYVRADELRPDDFLILPRLKCNTSIGLIDLSDYHDLFVIDKEKIAAGQRLHGGVRRAPKSKYTNRIIHPDKDLGMLLGWVLAEGSKHSDNSIECVYNISESDFALQMGKIAHAKFGASYSLSERDGSTGRIVIGSKFLLGFCTSVGILPNKTPNIRRMLDYGECFVKGFVIGAVYGDGSYTDGHWRFKAKRLQTCIFLRDMIHAVGGAASICRNSSMLEGKRFDAYSVTIIELDFALIKHYYKGIPKTKQLKSAIGCKDYVLYTIRSIVASDPPEIVYDFHVRDRNSICLPGHVVHNSDPFEGGDTDYYRPHLIATMLSDTSAMEAKYGSKSAYWSHGTMFPTPHNVFGLSILADPYYVERKHYYDRPYPITGRSNLAEFPIWGNILDATLGEVIKPTKVMHENELAHYITQTPEFSGDKGLQSVAQQLSLAQIRPGKVLPRVEGTQDDIGHAIYDMTEFAGLKGFLFTSLKKQVTGSPDFSDQGARWASADDIYNKSDAYYDLQLGGMLGATEFFRRFLPHRQNQIDYVNPLSNEAPAWLPGKRSVFGDTDFIDFHSSDPYTRIKEGSKRLPGAQYEAIHELHSGKKGEYDAFDRMKILADVSPYSNAFKYYKNIVDKMAQDGQLDGYWMDEYLEIDRRIKGEGLPDFEAETASKELGISGAAAGTAGLLNNHLRIPWVGTKLMSMDQDPLVDYQEKISFNNDFNDWTKPIDTMLMPYMRAQSARGAISGAFGGATLGVLSSAAGGSYAGTVGAIGAGVGTVMGLAGVNAPENEIRRRSMEEYFDSLEYLKYNKLADKAGEQGNIALANRLRRMSKRTMVGLDYSQDTTSFYKAAYSALPKPDRQYLQAFIQVDPGKRPEVLDKVPDYMQPILMRLWKDPKSEADAGKLSRVDQNNRAHQAALSYVNSHGGVPDDDSMVWHPDISIEDVKLKTIKNLGADIHNFGFWGTDERDLERTRPYIKPLPFSYNTNTYQSNRLNFTNNMLQYGFSNVYVDLIRNPSRQPENVYSINIQRNRLGDIAGFDSRSEGRF